jgi:hypothetical protein
LLCSSNLVGTLPASISAFTGLTSLNVALNKLSVGLLPPLPFGQMTFCYLLDHMQGGANAFLCPWPNGAMRVCTTLRPGAAGGARLITKYDCHPTPPPTPPPKPLPTPPPTPPPAPMFSCDKTKGTCAVDAKGTQTQTDCAKACATPVPTPPPTPPSPSPSASSSGGAVVGGVCTGLAVLVLAGVMFRRLAKENAELRERLVQPDLARQTSDRRRAKQKKELDLRERELNQADATRRGRSTDIAQPPLYWSLKSLKHTVRRVNVTGEMKARVQQLLDSTCNSSTLGKGRDAQAGLPPYTRLVVHKVTRIENPAIWRTYVAKRATLKQQLHGCQVPDVAVKTDTQWLPPLDATVNEKFMWHGTKVG